MSLKQLKGETSNFGHFFGLTFSEVSILRTKCAVISTFKGISNIQTKVISCNIDSKLCRVGEGRRAGDLCVRLQSFDHWRGSSYTLCIQVWSSQAFPFRKCGWFSVTALSGPVTLTFDLSTSKYHSCRGLPAHLIEASFSYALPFPT